MLAVGGGSAIDTAKAASAASGLRLVSVPTTYSGAEWAPSFGIRSRERRILGGGSGARLAAIVYDVSLTLELRRAETVGTALNALAHCAEALYGPRRCEAGDARALEACAELIARSLPACRRLAARPRGAHAGSCTRRRRRGRGARARRPRRSPMRSLRRSAAASGSPTAR